MRAPLALGPVIVGARHAAHATSDYPLYGVRDSRLIFLHATFPTTIVMLSALVAASLASLFMLATFGTSLLPAVSAGLLTLLARLETAFKGPLPVSLLTPIVSPMGDLSLVLRLAWALEGPLLALGVGSAAAVLSFSPLPALLLAGVMVWLARRRWNHRR